MCESKLAGKVLRHTVTCSYSANQGLWPKINLRCEVIPIRIVAIYSDGLEKAIDEIAIFPDDGSAEKA